MAKKTNNIKQIEEKYITLKKPIECLFKCKTFLGANYFHYLFLSEVIVIKKKITSF